MRTTGIKITLVFVLTLSTVAYFYFTGYQPKLLKQLQEIKGVQVAARSEIPYPLGYELISETKTSETKQFTFRTNKTPKELQTFYRGILLEDNWKLDKNEENDGFLVSTYKRDREYVIVSASRKSEENITVGNVVVTIKNNYSSTL